MMVAKEAAEVIAETLAMVVAETLAMVVVKVPLDNKSNHLYFITMANKKNEEVQSRRDFFKKAGKGILPILGMMVLSSIPTIVNATEKTPSGCNTNCQIGCAYNCHVFCEGSCKDTCKTTCTGSCLNGCSKSCKVHCNNTCKNTCENSCRSYNTY
ncbi:hypothetical protein [Prevotella sp.]|uniref:hypothetical protein n=1 Tax=Prevotella sp. TaxID=59823 RepID=UPI0027E2D73C|nr:hypothetical protein [Prevotella sp.]